MKLSVTSCGDGNGDIVQGSNKTPSLITTVENSTNSIVGHADKQLDDFIEADDVAAPLLASELAVLVSSHNRHGSKSKNNKIAGFGVDIEKKILINICRKLFASQVKSRTDKQWKIGLN